VRALERRLFACVPRAARALLELASSQPAPRGGLVARVPRACWTWSGSATHAHAGALGRCVVIACGTPPPSTRTYGTVRGTMSPVYTV